MKIVRQKDNKDCGICCLQSILKYYGGYVSLEQMRMDAKVTREGTTALNLVLAGKKYGFDAIGASYQKIEEVNQLPAIAHVNLKNGMTHYVVVYKLMHDKIILMDPAKGKVIMTKKEFYDIWSKVMILFYPLKNIVTLKKENTLFKIFGRILLREKKLLISIIIFSILLTLFTILGGYYFQVMGNALNNHFDKTFLKILIVVFGLFVGIKLSLSYLRRFLESHLNKNIDCILNVDFLRHLYHLPLSVIASRTVGEIVTRVRELTNVKGLVTDLIINSSLDFCLMLATLPLLINISSKLFFILFVFLLFYLVVGVISSQMFYKKAYNNIEYEAEFNNVIIEDIEMINSIKNLDVIDNRLKRLDKSLTKFLYDSFLLNNFLNKERTIKETISEVCLFLINTIGFYLVFKQELKIIELITFNTFLGFFFDPLKGIIDGLPKYNFLKASITKLNDFLSVDEEKEGSLISINANDIEIINLKYSYNKYNYILNNVNFKIKAGEFVCINGHSGCGKSTICKILDKYITDYEGDILIGGINIKDLSIKTIRNNIVYVNQQEAIFTGTIRENITLGLDVDEDRFGHVCKLCGIDLIVENKNLRYETGISNEASNISGGEKERIILARALLKDFKILILDEALSEVDYKLERRIMNNIKKEYPDKTIIYITHKKHNKMFDSILNLGDAYELS